MARSTASEAKNAARKAVKKTHAATVVLAILFLVIGAAAGFFAYRYVTRNDEFVLRGESVVWLNVGEEYVEEGVHIVSFGRDVSEKVTVGGDELDVNAEEIYQIVYKVEDIRWGNFQRVRTVIVGNPEGAEDYRNG